MRNLESRISKAVKFQDQAAHETRTDAKRTNAKLRLRRAERQFARSIRGEE